MQSPLAHSLFPIQTSFAPNHLRTRLKLVLDQEKIFKAIDADPVLIGSGVVDIDSWGTFATCPTV
jgi:hypothetical protein